MKQLKAKTVAALLTASMALGMTGCTIELDGDVKQVESLLASVAQNYQTSPSGQNGPEKQDQTPQSYVLDENGNIVTTEETDETSMGSKPADLQNGQQNGPKNGPKPSDGTPKGAGQGTKPVPSTPGNAPESVKVEESEQQATETAPKSSQETAVSSEAQKNEKETVPSEVKETEITYPEKVETSATVEESSSEEPIVPSEQKNLQTMDMFDAWPYRNIVSKYEGNYKAKFSFLHIDEDEIPELVITDTSTVDDGYVLSIYTYIDGEAVAIYDNIMVESYDTHTYTPYQNRTALIYESDVCEYTVIRESTLEEMYENTESLWVEADENTPNYPIRGAVSYQKAMEYLRNCYFPTDDEFLGLHYGYYPSYLYIEDYSKYNGNYWENYETQNLSVYVDEDGKSVGVYMWFYRTAQLDPVSIPLYGNYATFYYQGTEDRNSNGQIDPGEHFYRKATLELQEYGVQVVIEELPDASYIVPELDVSDYFGGGCYIKENTYFFSLQHKS